MQFEPNDQQGDSRPKGIILPIHPDLTIEDYLSNDPDPTEPEPPVYLEIGQFGPGLDILLHYTSIPAGFPSPAADYLDDPIDLNKLLIKTPTATYFVKVEGDSMKDANIPNGGLLVVDRSLKARSGDIIVAVLNGEFTIKRLQDTPAGVLLLPANPKYKAIHITDDMNFQVWGVVTKVIIDAKEL